MYISHLICHPFLKVLLAENLQNWEAPICLVLNKGITNSMDRNLSKVYETVEDRGAWHAVVHEVAKSQTRLSN